MTELDFLTAIGKVDQKYVGECLEYKAPSPITVFATRAAAVAACAVSPVVEESPEFAHGRTSCCFGYFTIVLFGLEGDMPECLP